MCAELVDGYIRGRIYIVASPPKTGTTSVGLALKQLGAGTHIMPYDGALLAKYKHEIRHLNILAMSVKGVWEFERLHTQETRDKLAGLIKECAAFDIFPDAPMGHTHIHPFVRSVIAPDAKFIWINREFKAWRISVEHWQTSHPEIYPSHTKWKTHRTKKLAALRKQWRARRREFRRLGRWRPEDCLELDLEHLSRFDALAEFCDLPNIKADFPKMVPGHRGSFLKRLMRLLRRSIRNIGQK